MSNLDCLSKVKWVEFKQAKIKIAINKRESETTIAMALDSDSWLSRKNAIELRELQTQLDKTC